LIAMTAVGLALWRLRPIPRFLEGLNILVGMVFLCGAGIAFYHMGVEYGWFPAPAGCAVPTPQDAAAAATGDLGLSKRMATSSCTDVPWAMLGLSMAGWNMVISAILAGLSFYASRRTRVENLHRAQAELGEAL
jgi:disulfide bond formation protein DsbB